MNTQRLNQLTAAMRQAGLPQLLISDPHSIAYLTGDFISPGERFLALLVRPDKAPVLFLNKLFAARHTPPRQIVSYNDTQRAAVLASEYTDPSVPLGVDKTLRAEFLLELQAHHAASSYQNGSPLIDQVRACKDAEEITAMADASRINDEAMLLLKDALRTGITERQLADHLIKTYRALGADDVSFSPIICFGANASDPHHRADDTPLTPGCCVLFDIGCRKNGYCSDMTRTYYYGSVTEEERCIYNLVLQANLASEAGIRPGVRFCDIDRTARHIIEDGGYGPQFTHRLGHSIGRECHEWGDVSSSNPAPVKAGMIFSCEPGIYLPGKTGVRIEDLCLVTDNGVQILNRVPKELEVLPLR